MHARTSDHHGHGGFLSHHCHFIAAVHSVFAAVEIRTKHPRGRAKVASKKIRHADDGRHHDFIGDCGVDPMDHAENRRLVDEDVFAVVGHRRLWGARLPRRYDQSRDEAKSWLDEPAKIYRPAPYRSHLFCRLPPKRLFDGVTYSRRRLVGRPRMGVRRALVVHACRRFERCQLDRRA